MTAPFNALDLRADRIRSRRRWPRALRMHRPRRRPASTTLVVPTSAAGR